MSGALAPMALQLGKRAAQLGFQAVQRRRKRRIRNNQWVLGSRLLGLPFASSSTPRARFRSRRSGRRRSGGSGMTNTTVSQPYTFGNVVRQQVAPAARLESGNEDLDVVSSITSGDDANGFWCESYSINPMESDTFARLANVASQYQRYTFDRLALVYTPFKGTTQAGELMLGFAADPQTTDPTTETEFMGLFGAVRAPVNLPATFNVSPMMFSKALNQYMLRMNKSPTAADDNVVSSVGRFFWATQNVGALKTNLGRLAISYQLRLLDPKIRPEAALVSNSVNFGSIGSGDTWSVLEYSSASPGAVYQTAVDDEWWHSRLRCNGLLVLRYQCAALAESVVSLDGLAPLTATYSLVDGDGRYCQLFVIPPRGQFTITAGDATVNAGFSFLPSTHDLADVESARV